MGWILAIYIATQIFININHIKLIEKQQQEIKLLKQNSRANEAEIRELQNHERMINEQFKQIKKFGVTHSSRRG